MDPENMHSTEKNIQIRPKFSCSCKNVPWADGDGPPERHAETVENWSSFQGFLPDTNSERYPKNVRGITLKSQCRAP